MKKTLFIFFKLWFRLFAGLMFITLATHGFGSGMNVVNDMNLFVSLMKQKGHLVFRVSVTNKTSTELRLAYSACPLTYVVKVGNKDFTYPEKQPFAEAKICKLSLAQARVPPKSSVVVYIAQLGDEFENALIRAKGNYSGEFRFKLSTTRSKGIFQLIYRRQQR